MRNLFDQFQQPENRLTHALMSSLHEDPGLLKRFIHWAIGESAPNGELTVVEQSLPGQDEGEELTEQQRRGLPDGWIYDDDGWRSLSKARLIVGSKTIRSNATSTPRGARVLPKSTRWPL